MPAPAWIPLWIGGGLAARFGQLQTWTFLSLWLAGHTGSNFLYQGSRKQARISDPYIPVCTIHDLFAVAALISLYRYWL